LTACDVCKGACCESIVLGVRYEDKDAQRWLSYHGEVRENGVRFECRCSKLRHGKCTIYDSRPEVCRVFEVGSPACLEAIEHRRKFKSAQILKLIEAGHGEEAKG